MFRDPCLGSQIVSCFFLTRTGTTKESLKSIKYCLLYLLLNSASLETKKSHVYYVRRQAFLYVTLREENRSTAIKGSNSRTLSVTILSGSGTGRLPLRFHGTTLPYYKGFFFSSGWFLFYRYPQDDSQLTAL